VDGGSPRRLAENESIYRQLNERIEAGHELTLPNEEVAFLCECGQLGCNAVLGLSLREYEEIRDNPRWFGLAPGHEMPELERVVIERSGYIVVEKMGVAGAIAEATDPRDED